MLQKLIVKILSEVYFKNQIKITRKRRKLLFSTSRQDFVTFEMKHHQALYIYNLSTLNCILYSNLNTIYLYLLSDLFTFNISKKRVLKWQLFSQNIEEEGSSFFI